MGRRDRALHASTGMAGNDPGGASWAASYDHTAASAAHATLDAVAAVDQLAAMFEQTARNYAAADAASTAANRRSVATSLNSVYDPAHINDVVLPPSAAGGSGHHPPGWSLVAGAINHVWPNGHQDKLHAAADAWAAAAQVIEVAAATIGDAGMLTSDIPEHDDIVTTCRAMGRHLDDVAHVHHDLARTCRQLAHHIDRCHAEVINELKDLVEWTAGSEIVGGILAAVTAGASEVVANGTLALRIARVAAKVNELLETFATAARALADTMPALAATADRARVVFVELGGNRLAIAGMEDVSRLPGAARAAKAGSSGVRLTKAEREEAAATERVAAAAEPEAAATSAHEFSPELQKEIDRAIANSRINKVANWGHDGKRFHNRKGQLPEGPEYHEWTINAPDARRGGHRLVIAGDLSDPTAIYYWDHKGIFILIGP